MVGLAKTSVWYVVNAKYSYVWDKISIISHEDEEAELSGTREPTQIGDQKRVRR